AVVRVLEAGEAFIQSVGNEHQTRALPRETWGRWGPVDKHTGWRCEPLSFAYFSLRRQRKVGAAPHRGNASKPITSRGCHRKAPKNPRISVADTPSPLPHHH